MKTLPFLCLFLPAALAAQEGAAPAADRILATAQARAAWPFDRVLHDSGMDGRLWAAGATWKASFGTDGFTYLPRLGATAPASSLHFDLTAVRVDSHDLPVLQQVAATRDGDVVSFARGAVRESYRLALDHVEQTFIVDAGPGDVEVELTLATELTERADVPGLQFANDHGEVGYGDAFLVVDGQKQPIATVWDGRRLTLRVAAAQRGPGPVVIDPILNTRTSSTTANVPSLDVAYDASLQRYLLVWAIQVSSTDADVVTEQFDALGNPIAGSAAPVEISGLRIEHPRTASLDVADAYLVAFSLYDPNFGNRRMVYSRVMDAATSAVGPYELLSNPSLPGENLSPEVGADPGTDPGSPHDWLVVWTNANTSSDANVHGRAVLANGTPKHAWVLVIEDGVDTYNEHVRVSRSNGNGRVPNPQWLVAYDRRIASGIVHVFGRTLDLGFVASAEIPITTTSFQNTSPQVCSPIAFGSGSAFLVTWERAAVASAQASLLLFAPAYSGDQQFDLSALFGIRGSGMRCDSDGIRFVVASRGATGNDWLLSTLAFDGSNLVRHEGPVMFGTASISPEIVACRSSGGPVAQYGIAWRQGAFFETPTLTRYGGYQGGSLVTVQNTACHGLGIQASGTPVLGDAMQFALGSIAGDLPGFAFGFPAANPIPICATCSLGLRIDLPIVVDFGSPSFVLPIPPAPGLVGSAFAVQGLGLGTWPCFGLRFSNAVQFTVR